MISARPKAVLSSHHYKSNEKNKVLDGDDERESDPISGAVVTNFNDIRVVREPIRIADCDRVLRFAVNVNLNLREVYTEFGVD